MPRSQARKALELRCWGVAKSETINSESLGRQKRQDTRRQIDLDLRILHRPFGVTQFRLPDRFAVGIDQQRLTERVPSLRRIGGVVGGTGEIGEARIGIKVEKLMTGIRQRAFRDFQIAGTTLE